MPAIDRSVVLEAISALTNTTVKPLIDDDRNADLTTDNFLKTVFSSSNSTNSALRRDLFVDIKKFFDPSFDFDFSGGSDSGNPCRGGESYSRPWGWYRFALKVRNKYLDGNAWLGSGGWRNRSSPGEWPVSFHGTSIEGARGIVSSYYRAGERQAFGRGIYSTPDIKVAERYVKLFKSQNEKTYKVIMQNRINPEKRVVTSNELFWLIPVARNTPPEREMRISEKSIRPYGILIREETMLVQRLRSS